MPQHLSPKVPESVGVAVLGLGPWGCNLVRAFDATPGCRVVVIHDPDPVRLAACTAAPTAERESETPRVLCRADVSAVVIAAPAELHVPLAEAALGHGKHALVEKPMALSVEGAERLVRLAGERSRRLMVGHVLEHHPAVTALQSLILCGELGRVDRVVSFRFGPAPSRREGAWWSLAPHDISLALRFLQARPQSVLIDRVAEDDGETVAAKVHFDEAKIAEVRVGTRHPNKIRRTLVFGSRAIAEIDDCRTDGKLRLLRRTMDLDDAADHELDFDAHVVPCSDEAPLRAEAAAFIRAIRDGCPVVGDGRSGLAVTRVLAAGEQALETGKMELVGEPPRVPAFAGPRLEAGP